MQPNTNPASDHALTAEMRLEANRARIRRTITARPTPRSDEHKTSPLRELAVLAHVLEPAASELVRRHPVRSLAMGAATGALLVNLKHLRGPLSAILTAELMRKATAASFQWVIARAISRDATPL